METESVAQTVPVTSMYNRRIFVFVEWGRGVYIAIPVSRKAPPFFRYPPCTCKYSVVLVLRWILTSRT
jgi:hypothetical protein